jgi:hypothetical protein
MSSSCPQASRLYRTRRSGSTELTLRRLEFAQGARVGGDPSRRYGSTNGVFDGYGAAARGQEDASVIGTLFGACVRVGTGVRGGFVPALFPASDDQRRDDDPAQRAYPGLHHVNTLPRKPGSATRPSPGWPRQPGPAWSRVRFRAGSRRRTAPRVTSAPSHFGASAAARRSTSARSTSRWRRVTLRGLETRGPVGPIGAASTLAHGAAPGTLGKPAARQSAASPSSVPGQFRRITSAPARRTTDRKTQQTMMTSSA